MSRVCSARLARVAGTHGLFFDGMSMPVPAVAGVARWTTLQPGATGWEGPLRANAEDLPFADCAFCVVLACFADDAWGVQASELARVLAPHGTVLVAGLHPRSLWRCGIAPGHWERALRRAGLDVVPAVRCGAPWPRLRGAQGLPRWLTRTAGGGWVVEARHSVLAMLPLRKAKGRPVESNALLPGARRQCA